MYVLATICDPDLLTSILVINDSETSDSSSHNSRHGSGDKDKEQEKGKEGRNSSSGRIKMRFSLHLPSHLHAQSVVRSDVFDALGVFIGGGLSFCDECDHLHKITGLWKSDPNGTVSVAVLTVCIYIY